MMTEQLNEILFGCLSTQIVSFCRFYGAEGSRVSFRILSFSSALKEIQTNPPDTTKTHSHIHKNGNKDTKKKVEICFDIFSRCSMCSLIHSSVCTSFPTQLKVSRSDRRQWNRRRSEKYKSQMKSLGL